MTEQTEEDRVRTTKGSPMKHDPDRCPRCGHAAGDHYVEGFFPGGTEVGLACLGCSWKGTERTPLAGRCRWDAAGPLTLSGRPRQTHDQGTHEEGS